MIEGPNLIDAARGAGHPLDALFSLEDEPGAFQVSEDVMRYLAPTLHPRGPIAVMEIPPSATVTRPCLVAFDLADPGNLGTLIRSAAAFGMQVAVTAGCTDAWGPKALRSGAGAHFMTTIERGARVAALRERGFTIVSAVPMGGAHPTVLSTIDLPAILIGSEAHGLPEELEPDLTVTIPIAVESLNAAVAGGILAYAYSAQHGSDVSEARGDPR